jgi:hypothetical protein
MDYTCKVESIETTSNGGKSIKLSGGWTGSALFTGKDKYKNVVPFPENEVKVGATIECTIETVETESGKWYALSFPKYEQSSTPPAQSTQGYQGKRVSGNDDIALRIVSFGNSYSKDHHQNTPGASLQDVFKSSDLWIAKMTEQFKVTKEALGG